MPETSVKFFHDALPGAPVMSGQAGSLIAILDACLVNGFGLKTVDSLAVSGGIATATISTGHSAVPQTVVLISGATPAGLNGEKKVISTTTNTITFDATGISDQTATGTITLKLAPAGWEKAFSGTNLAAYKSANPSASGCFVRFDDAGTTTATFRGYESMTDVSAGSGIFPTAAQESGALLAMKSTAADATARKWFVIANDKMAYVGLSRLDGANAGCYAGIYFGDIISRKSADPWRFAVHGGDTSGYSPTATNNPFVASDGANLNGINYMPRDSSGTGGSVRYITASLQINQSGYVSGNGLMPYPNPADNGLILSPLAVIELTAKTLRGELPGLLLCPQNAANRICPDGSSLTTFITDVPSQPGRTILAVPMASGSYQGAFAPGFIDLTGPWGNEVEHSQASRISLLSVVVASPLTWPVRAKAPLPLIRGAVDVLWGGSGRIVGTVKEKGSPANVPVWRRVRLFHERTAALIAETWSDPVTGAYAFNYIKRNEVYFVLAFDHTGDYRGVVADNLTPEAMP